LPVDDVVAVAERKYEGSGEASADGSFGRRVKVFASKNCQPRHKGANVDETGERLGAMRGFRVQIRDVQGKSVLRHVDHLWRRAVDLDILAVEWQRYVVGRLTFHGQDNSTRSLRVVDVENGFQAEVLKVRSVRLVVVSADGLRVVVDRDSGQTLVAKCAVGSNTAPIERNRGTDAINT